MVLGLYFSVTEKVFGGHIYYGFRGIDLYVFIQSLLCTTKLSIGFRV